MGIIRSAYRKIPEPVRDNIFRRRAELNGLGQMAANMRLLAMELDRLAREREPLTAPPDVPDPRFPDGVRSRMCTEVQLFEPWYGKWCAAVGEKEPPAHMKFWEWAYVLESLDRLGLLEPGRRAVGFGVGQEPIVAAYANLGVEIVATDLEAGSEDAADWQGTNQHAHGTVESLLRPELCDPDRFRELVTWRPADMRAIPGDLRGFDFCWSICALEHLGSLGAGLDFIEGSLATLKPGGIAIHTTAFNVGSNDDTVETGRSVAYRERDLLAFRDRVEAKGHEVAALDFNRGEGLLDRYTDVPPYGTEPVLRWMQDYYSLTSVAIIVRAKPE